MLDATVELEEACSLLPLLLLFEGRLEEEGVEEGGGQQLPPLFRLFEPLEEAVALVEVLVLVLLGADDRCGTTIVCVCESRGGRAGRRVVIGGWLWLRRRW